MINNIRLYRADCTDPYRNLAVEQYLLETAPADSCTLYLWQNRRTVVIGRNQNAWKECRTMQLEADGGFLARRLSGGGAVFHDLGNLNFTFLVNKEDYDLPRQLGVIVEACRLLGIPAECSGRNDVLSGGRKFSGNAFYEHQGKSYHHGTLLVDVNMENMSRYLSPSKAKLAAKGVESVRSRVVNLRELKPDLTVSEMAGRMEDAFQRVYGLAACRLEEGDLDQSRINALGTRNGSWEWLYGRALQCTLDCAARFDWGEVSLQLSVEEGSVREAKVYTDAMDWSFAPEAEQALTGCRFQIEEMQRALRTVCPGQMSEDLCGLLAEQDI